MSHMIREVGSKILITTRSCNVSSIVKTVSDISLQKLSDDDSLRMFVHHALGARDFSDHLDLKETGLQIVRKCDGLPLATKTIGGLLHGRMDCDAWKDILESEIWNLPEAKSGIIPALWLSYCHLSSQLKQCFPYCSIIPKDYEFTEQEIILLWMAEGFLNEANTTQTEDLSRKYFKELVSRSFFQVSRRKKSHFVMHNLINDLAQSVAGKICFRMEGNEQMKYPRHVRHSSYIAGQCDGIKQFQTFYSTTSV
ncbi:putative disease resistance RPP13-like protein 1 [Durio zibethinus]|uniref:Disease resistance RPP13-like protein 1 n=1 Tax=Durio zibethinus TaxID=66656 RepID=A0A6P6AHC3_DURZI|nr:putative disease resistance RPP13-like protein 1 [Durio zibethinus]